MSKNKTFRHKLELQLAELAVQTEELRKQVVERAPGVRDQIIEQGGELAKQVAERAPGVRDQIVAALPDKDQLLEMRDELFERLPDTVQEKLPVKPKPKPKRKRLRRVAAIGAVTGAGAAAFAIVRRRGDTPQNAYVTPTPPTPPAPPAATATSTGTGPTTAADVVSDAPSDPSDPAHKH